MGLRRVVLLYIGIEKLLCLLGMTLFYEHIATVGPFDKMPEANDRSNQASIPTY
jgi:hypothetical protein